MAKGKKGGKKKKEKKVDPNLLTQVDKTFYELTITDLNRKLARLRTLTEELEQKNEDLQTQLATLDEDRNDIIAYLKRTLQERLDEISELQERLQALQEARQDETAMFEAKIEELENEYKQMHEQLTSEIKLLEGKLNSLEEFRILRDELMKKFEEQEIQMEEQEKRHRDELYEIERKFIIGKDKLKKDMEARLLQLSSEFQEATELRIAATTHRVIRENIAINNELDVMLETHEKLHNENISMKERDRTLKQEAELHEAEKNIALGKVKVQMKVIERLTKDHEEMEEKLAKYQTIEQELHEANVQLNEANNSILSLNHKIRILEQNLHAARCRETSICTNLEDVEDNNDRLTAILTEAVIAIKEVLEVKSKISDESLRVSKRETLLSQLFILLSEAEMKKARKPSLETVPSLSATYEKGDLGFVPKPEPMRPPIRVMRTIEVQMGKSFEEFLAIGTSEDQLQKLEGSLVMSVEEMAEGEEVEEEESDMFFDEEEESGEELVAEFEGLEEEEGDEPKMPARAESVTAKPEASAVSVTKEAVKPDEDAEKKSATSKGSKGSTTGGDETAAETSPLPEDAPTE